MQGGYQGDRKGSVRASQALLPVPQTGFPYYSFRHYLCSDAQNSSRGHPFAHQGTQARFGFGAVLLVDGFRYLASLKGFIEVEQLL
jgi:hypothetical protein